MNLKKKAGQNLPSYPSLLLKFVYMCLIYYLKSCGETNGFPYPTFLFNHPWSQNWRSMTEKQQKLLCKGQFYLSQLPLFIWDMKYNVKQMIIVPLASCHASAGDSASLWLFEFTNIPVDLQYLTPFQVQNLMQNLMQKQGLSV